MKLDRRSNFEDLPFLEKRVNAFSFLCQNQSWRYNFTSYTINRKPMTGENCFDNNFAQKGKGNVARLIQ